LLLFLCAAAGACGYRFSGSGELPGGVETLYIDVFENKSGETGFETHITNDLIYQFTRFDSRRLADPSVADARLTGIIKSISAVTISHRTAQTTAERRLQATIAVKLTGADGKRLWSDNAITAYETYAVSPDKAQTERNKKSALATLSSRVAERIYYRLTDDF
jgi:outer membrane lipopolysaccharide assembly protein LptE/RlpB